MWREVSAINALIQGIVDQVYFTSRWPTLGRYVGRFLIKSSFRDGIQWNPDNSNLQKKLNLVRVIGGKITVLTQIKGKRVSFGSSHIRRFELSRV